MKLLKRFRNKNEDERKRETHTGPEKDCSGLSYSKYEGLIISDWNQIE